MVLSFVIVICLPRCDGLSKMMLCFICCAFIFCLVLFIILSFVLFFLLLTFLLFVSIQHGRLLVQIGFNSKLVISMLRLLGQRSLSSEMLCFTVMVLSFGMIIFLSGCNGLSKVMLCFICCAFIFG